METTQRTLDSPTVYRLLERSAAGAERTLDVPAGEGFRAAPAHSYRIILADPMGQLPPGTVVRRVGADLKIRFPDGSELTFTDWATTANAFFDSRGARLVDEAGCELPQTGLLASGAAADSTACIGPLPVPPGEAAQGGMPGAPAGATVPSSSVPAVVATSPVTTLVAGAGVLVGLGAAAGGGGGGGGGQASAPAPTTAAPTGLGLDAGSDSGVRGDGLTNDSTPTLTGKAEANSDVTIRNAAGTPLVTVRADANGNWSATPGAALPDGVINLQAVANNGAGTTDSPPVSITLTVDTAAPSSPVPRLEPASDSGVLGDNLTNDATPTISGTGTTGDSIRVTLPGGTVLTTTVAPNGTWSVTPGAAQALPSGQNTISVTAVDPAGNASTSIRQTITVDAVAPAVPVAALAPASDSGAAGDNVTNDATPTVSGTGAAGDTIRVTLPGGAVLVTTVAADGTWSVTPGAGQSLATGSNTLSVTATDPAGNSSAATNLVVSIVTLGPQAPTAALDPASDSGSVGDRITSDTTPTISGTGTAGDTIRVTLPGGTVLTTTVAADGSWSVTPSNAQALPNGPNTVSVTATDSSGNNSAPGSVTVTVDAAASAAPVAALAPASDSGAAGDNVTNDATPTLSGTGTAGDTIRVTLPGGAVLVTTVAADGTWSVTPGAGQALTTGSNTLTVTATDPAGNSSAATNLVVSIVTVGPQAPTATLDPASDSGSAGDRITSDTTPTISGTGTAGDTIRVMLPGGAVLTTIVAADGSWSVTPNNAQALPNGSSTVSVTAVDPAGNASSTIPLTITVDAAPPAAPVAMLAPASDSGAAGDNVTNDATPTISGTGAAGDTIRVTLPGGTVLTTIVSADGTWSVTPGNAQALLTGSNTLSVTATDPAGNSSAATNLVLSIVTIGPQAPTVALDPISDSGASGDRLTSDTTPTITGTGTAGDNIRVTLPDGSVLTTTVAADGSWSVTPSNAQALPNGPNTVSVTATDSSGNNSAPSSVTITVDAAAPAAPVAALAPGSDSGASGDRLTSDTTPTITGTGTAGDSIRVTLPGGAALITTVAADGTWSVTPGNAQALPNGSNTLTVTAVDPAGNASSTIPLTITVDAAPPAVPVAALAPASDSGASGDRLTNDTTPTITGTGAAGDTIRVTLPDGSVLTTTVATDNTWSVTPGAGQALANGSNTLTVTATDPAGNTSSTIPLTITVDAAAPAAPVAALAPASDSGAAGDNITNDATPTISGIGTAGDTIRVTLPGGAVLVTTVAADGTWSVTPGNAQALPNGSNTLTVTAVDPAGNASPTIPLTITVDAAPPAAPVAALAPASDSGASGDGLTNDTTPTISGTGTAGDTIRVMLPGGTVLTTIVGTDGTWSVTPGAAQALPNGSNTLTVTAVDPAGNASSTIPLTIVVDAAPPAAPVAALAPASDSGASGDRLTNDTTPTLTGTGTAGDTIRVTLPGGTVLTTIVGTDGTWSVTPGAAQALPNGSNTLTVTAVDPAGNASSTIPLTITVDATAPTVPTALLAPASDSGAAGDNVTNDATPTISGTGTAGDTIRVTLPGGTVLTTTVAGDGTWSVTPGAAQALAPGSNTLTVTATDLAGNSSAATNLVLSIVTIGPQAPTVALDPISDSGITGDQVTNDATPTISGTGVAGDTIRVTLPSGAVLTTTVAADGSWSVTPGNAQALPDGRHTLYVTATDSSGNNSAPGSVTITVDATAPSAPTSAIAASSDSGIAGDDLTNDTTPTISGTGAAGDTIRVALPGGVVLTTTVASDGTWSVTPVNTQALATGSNTIGITASDQAGNVSSPVTRTITIDTTAPAAPAAVLDRSSDSGTAGDNVTNDRTPTISGTGTAGDTIRVTLPGGTVLTTTVTADGTWNLTPTSAQALAPGSNTLAVTATDPAGNSSAATILVLSIVTIGPQAPTAALDPGSDSGASGDRLTNDATPTISGTGTAGDTIRVTLSGGAVLTTTVAADGTWSVTPSDAQALANGSHTLWVTMTDAAGNVSAPTPVVVIVDTTLPDAPTIESSEGPRINAAENADGVALTLTGAFLAGDTVSVLVTPPGGGATVTVSRLVTSGEVSAGRAVVQVPGLATQGEYSAVGRIIDAAGNVGPGSAAPAMFTLDTAAPSAPTAMLAPASDSGVAGDNVTNDATPTISGTGIAGDTIRVALPGGAVLTTIVAADGSWSVTPSNAQALAPGSNTLTVTTTDPAGNSSAATNLVLSIVTIGPQAPTAALDPASDSGAAGDRLTSDATPTISGTGTAGDTIRVTLPDGTVLTTTVGPSGNWSVTPSAAQALPDGSNTLTVTAVDPAGNASSTIPLTITVDAAPPAAPVAALAPASDSGASGDRLTNDTTPTIAGSGAAGDTIRVTLPDGTVLTTVVAADGTWSVTPGDAQALPNGPNTLTVTAVDPAGNASSTIPLTITVDATAPTAPTLVLAPASDSGAAGDNVTSDATPTISGTGTAGDTIRVTLPGGTVLTTSVATDGTWSVTPSNAQALPNGSSLVSVTATDPAGNTSAATSRAITVDTSAPTAPTVVLAPASDSGAAGDNVTNDATPTLTGTGAAGDTIRVTLPGGTVLTTIVSADGTWSVTPSNAQALLTGSNTLTVTATDSAGNSSAATSLVLSIVTIGPQAPTVALDPASDSGSAGDRLTDDTTPTISGTGVAGDTIRVTLPGGAVLTTTVAADGSWSVTPGAGQALANGSNTLTVTAVDPGGNASSTIPLTITIDAAPPAAPVAVLAPASDSGAAGDNVTNDATPTISGTGAAGDTIRVTLPGGAVLVTTVAADGTWSVTPGNAQALAPGSNTLSVTATDPAGNSSAATSLVLSIVTIGPQSPTVVLDPTSDSGVSGDRLTSDATPTISGTGVAGDTIRVTLPGGAVLTTTVAADGSWSVTPSNAQALPNGSNTLTVTAVDPAGNTSSTIPLTITVDATAPAAPVAALAPASDSGAAGDNVTNDATPTLTGMGTAGDTIRVTLPGGTVLTTVIAADGTWSVTPGAAQALATGSNTLTVTATDPAGNSSVATNLVLSIVTIGPQAPTAALDPGSDSGASGDRLTSDATPTISGTGVAGDTIRVTLPDGSVLTTTVAADGSWSVTPSAAQALATGLNTLTVTAVDPTGNASSTIPLTITVDAAAPAAPVAALAPASDSGASGDRLTNDTTPTLTGTGTAGDTIRVTLPGGAVLVTTVAADGTWSVTPGDAQALANGANTLTVTAVDPAGNASSATPLTITVDSAAAAPSPMDLAASSDTGSSDTDNLTRLTTPTLTGSGAEPGATVTLYDTDGTTVLGTGLADAGGNWSITSTPLSAGAHTLTARQTDLAGNRSAPTAGLVVTIDASALPPSVPDLLAASDSGDFNSDNLTRDTTPTFRGTGAEPGATVVLYDTDGGTVLGTGVADGSGSWSITSTALSEGSHTLRARQTDTAGNTSLFSASLGVTIDTGAAPPSAPDLAEASDSGSSSTDDITSVSSPRVTGTGAESGAMVTLYDTDGTTVLGTGTADGGGNWSINSSALTVGTHTLTARQTDRAGNTSAPSPALVVTIEPEVLPLSAADLALDGHLGLSVDSEGILRFAVVDPADLASAAATPVTLTQGMASEEASSGSAIDLLLSSPAHAGSSLAMLC